MGLTKRTRQKRAPLTRVSGRAHPADLPQPAESASPQEGDSERLLAEVLDEITATIHDSPDLDTVLDQLLAAAARLAPYDVASVILVKNKDKDKGTYEARSQSFTGRHPSETNLALSPPADEPPEPGPTDELALSPQHPHVGTPLRVGDELIGILNLERTSQAAFTAADAERLQALADRAAAAVRNAQLYQTATRYAADLERRLDVRTAERDRTTERIEAILNHSSDAIILAYTDGTISQNNPTFDEMFLYQTDDLFRKPLSTLIHPDYQEAFNQALQSAIEGEQIEHLEVLAQRKDGTAFYAEVGLSLIQSTRNLRGGIVCSLHDITERKQAQDDLLKALEKERELNELKSRFVSMASHEFRTPLTTIVSSADLIENRRERMTPEQLQKHFNKIQSAARYMTDLLDDVLTLSRAEAKRMDFNPAPLNLEALCQDALEEVQVNAPPSLTFVFDYQGVCGERILDEKLMRYTITNLLSNAVKYSPEGGTVRLEVRCDEQGTALRVQDQGIGIPEKDHKYIFEPFHRAQNVGTIKGTGLGLSITRNAVELHGGTIRFESQPGSGTTFLITIPASPPKGESA